MIDIFLSYNTRFYNNYRKKCKNRAYRFKQQELFLDFKNNNENYICLKALK